MSRAEVTRRYPLLYDPLHDRKVVSMTGVAPLVEGMMSPLHAQPGPFDSRMPITLFQGCAWFENDPHLNVRRAAASLAPRLGSAAIGRSYNTLKCEWHAGAASIVLIAWPREWQSAQYRIPAHERDPRLATACHVSVGTGYRPPLAAHERIWLDTFEALMPIPQLGTRTFDRLLNAPAAPGLLQFVREPFDGLERLFGYLGRSSDGQALMFCHDQLYVIAADELLGFEVERMLPAKGGGGSTLSARCRADWSGRPYTNVPIAKGHGPEDLNEAGRLLASAFRKPYLLGEYTYDA